MVLAVVQTKPNRTRLEVMSFGTAPFGTDRKQSIIPNGFIVRRFTKKPTPGFYVIETRVEPGSLRVMYRFSLHERQGAWKSNPTGALDDLHRNDPEHRKGENGRVMVGIDTQPMQRAIREHFGSQQVQLPPQVVKGATTSLAKRKPPPPPPGRKRTKQVTAEDMAAREEASALLLMFKFNKAATTSDNQ